MSNRMLIAKQFMGDAMENAGLGAYMGVLLFLIDGSTQFSQLFYSHEPIISIFVSGLCAMAACGLAFAFHGALSPSAGPLSIGPKAALVAAAGFAGCLVVTDLHLSILLSIIGSVLFGAGLAAVGVGMCFRLMGDSAHRILARLAVAGLIASLLKMALLLLPAFLLGPALVVLTALSALMPHAAIAGISASDDHVEDLVALTRGLFGRNWIYLAGLIICTVLGTLMWKGLMIGDYAGYVSGPEGQIGSMAGSLLASILLSVLSRDASLRRLKAIMPIVPLLCIAAILLTWLIGVWDEGLDVLGGYGSQCNELLGSMPVGFSILTISVLLVFRVVDEIRRGLPPSFAFGLMIALISASFLLYTALQLVLSWESSRAVDLFLKVVYLMAAVGYLFKLTQRGAGRSASPLDRQIEGARDRFALSRRETEVLSLIAQGRSAPYIAEVEGIALSTVKTHIKRIYTKIGVHNREELLDIVYSIEDGQGS